MKHLKSKPGFSLVELIIVIAILAILAAIAIPAYSGYIKKARDAAALVELNAISTAALAANAASDVDFEIKIEILDSGRTADVSIRSTSDKKFSPDFKTDFETFCAKAQSGYFLGDYLEYAVEIQALYASLDATSYSAGAHWTAADGWTALSD